MDELEIKKLTDELVKLAATQATDEAVKQCTPVFEKLESELKGRITEDLEKTWGKSVVKKPDYTLGELAQSAMHKMGKFDGIDKGMFERVMTKANDFAIAVGARGGFLVPDQQPSNTLLNTNLTWQEIVYPRAMVLPTGTPPDAKIKIPARGQTATGAMDHLSFSNRAEGGAGTQTDVDISMIELEPTERNAYVKISDDLLANADILGAYLNAMFQEEKVYQNDYMFFKGTGASEPKGIYNSPAALKVTRDTASSVKYADIVKMRGKMIPMSLPRCAWVASVSVRPQIENMLDTGSHLVYGMGDISKGYPETLTGLPIIWSEHAAALGSETDLSLIDFGYYIIKPGTGPVINTSNDLYMLTRQTAIMMWWKVDGKSWLNLPILLRDGSTQVSPFVILD